MLSNSSEGGVAPPRKVHHVRKQLLALSAQLVGMEKEVAMLMERGIKVRAGVTWLGHMAGSHGRRAVTSLCCSCRNSCLRRFFLWCPAG